MKKISIARLNIIGYATRLSKAMLPTIVSPIFSLDTYKQIVLFPPFQIIKEEVIGGTLSNMREFKSFIIKQDNYSN